MKVAILALVTILPAISLSSSVEQAQAPQTCYGLDGKPTTFRPCPKRTSDQNHVACCGGGDICLSSGYCLYEGAQDSRGLLRADGCTDPTLKDNQCQPQVAPAVKKWQKVDGVRDYTGFLAVVACPSGKYCAIPAVIGAINGDESVGDAEECCRKAKDVHACDWQ